MNVLKVLGIIGICGFVVSACATEKNNLSPTTALIANISEKTPEDVVKNISDNLDLIKYSSDITNAFSSCSSFLQKPVNEEFSNLKFYITEYLYAVKEHNTMGKEKALYNYEKSYKKIQKLKNNLNEDEQEILNRFLVNIKTNITLIESLKDTL